MTQFSEFSASALTTTAKRWSISLICCAAVALLAACQSTPLPPWNGSASASDTTRTTGTTTRPGAFTSATLAGAPSGYSDAIAARYPAPNTSYNTPGLQNGRTTFTSNQEIQNFLSHLADGGITGITSKVHTIGRTQQGQDIHAFFISKGADQSSAAFDSSGKPTVLLVGGQHGSEPASTEALLVAAQQLTHGDWSKWLNNVNVIIVPLANPDGAARQVRSLSNQIDMNRDHLLLHTLETRAIAQLMRDYRPFVVVDHHEYPAAGAFRQKFMGFQYYDVYLQFASAPNTGEFVTKAANEWFAEPLFDALEAKNLSADWYTYTSSNLQDRTLSMGGIWPDTLRNVGGLKNSVSLLVESRGSDLGRIHIQRRVHSQVTVTSKVLEQAAARAPHLTQVRSYVNRDAASQACQGRLVIDSGQTTQNRNFTMLDPVTGADRNLTVSWKSSLQPRTTKERARPCGYLLAGTENDVIERLQLLGVTVMRVAEPGSLQIQRYNETRRNEGPRTDNHVQDPNAANNSIVHVEVMLSNQRAEVPVGSYYIPMGQPLAHLAAAALEPDTQSSYFANHILSDLGNVFRVVEPPALVFEEIE